MPTVSKPAAPIVPNVMCYVTIGGPAVGTQQIQFRPSTCNVKLSTYGSASTVEAITAISYSRNNTILHDVIQNISDGQQSPTSHIWAATAVGLTPIDVWMGYLAQPLPQSAQNSNYNLPNSSLYHVFSGFMDTTDWQYDKDDLIIKGRDASSLLMDSRVLKVDLQKTAVQIAQEYAASVNLDVVVGPGNGQTVGYIFKQDHASVGGTVPRTKWDILLFLSRSVQYECYVLPGSANNKPGVYGTLYFVPTNYLPQNANQYGFGTYTFDWRNPGNPTTSMKTFVVHHSPRRNQSFQVLVKSYHPKSAQPYLGVVTILGETIQFQGSKTVPAGVYRGQQFGTVYNELGTSTSGKNIPVYTWYQDGLDQAGAQAKADAIATDIAKRTYTADFVVSGVPNLTPHSKIQFRGGLEPDGQTPTLDPRFAAIPFFPVSIEHQFSMTEGFLTSVQALNIPPNATADPNVALEVTQ